VIFNAQVNRILEPQLLQFTCQAEELFGPAIACFSHSSALSAAAVSHKIR